jgi:hypothetical protein
MHDIKDAMIELTAKVDGLAHLLGATGEAIPPEAAHGLALVLGGMASQARAVLVKADL